MHRLIEYLQEEPGPWEIGFITRHEETEDFTAGSFCATINTYEISKEGDCLFFYLEEQGERKGEIIVPTLPLTFMGIENNTAICLNENLKVNVEGFVPQTVLFCRRK